MTALNPTTFATGHSHDPRQRVWNWNEVTPEDPQAACNRPCGKTRDWGELLAREWLFNIGNRNTFSFGDSGTASLTPCRPPATCNRLLPTGAGVIHGAMLNLFCNHLPIRSLMQ